MLLSAVRETVQTAAGRVQLVRGPDVQHRVARVHLDTGRRGHHGQPDGDRVPGQVQAHQSGALVPDRQPGAGRLPDGLVPAGDRRGRLVLPRRVLHPRLGLAPELHVQRGRFHKHVFQRALRVHVDRYADISIVTTDDYPLRACNFSPPPPLRYT